MIRNFIRTRAVALFALTTIAAAVACDSVTEPTTPIGEYSLLSVDGDNVPSTMFEDATYKLEVVRGTLEVDVDSSYIATIVSKETVDAVVSEYVDSLRGTWSQDESGTMQFTFPEDNTTFTGSWQGRKITILITSGLASTSLVYQK
jgi:hypothetical protein